MDVLRSDGFDVRLWWMLRIVKMGTVMQNVPASLALASSLPRPPRAVLRLLAQQPVKAQRIRGIGGLVRDAQFGRRRPRLGARCYTHPTAAPGCRTESHRR